MTNHRNSRYGRIQVARMSDLIGWSVLVNAGVGLIAAGTGGLVTYLWQHRRTTDRDFFLLLRQAIDRPAFRGPFMWKSDQVAMTTTVIIQAVNRVWRELGIAKMRLPNTRRGLRQKLALRTRAKNEPSACLNLL